jgi:hypothetical protein
MTKERTRISFKHESDVTLMRISNRDDDATVATLVLSPDDCEWLRKQLWRNKPQPPLTDTSEGKS